MPCLRIHPALASSHLRRIPPTGGIAAVAEALACVGLETYTAAFDAEGYDDIMYLRGLSEPERASVASETGMKPGHGAKFVKHGFDSSSSTDSQ